MNLGSDAADGLPADAKALLDAALDNDASSSDAGGWADGRPPRRDDPGPVRQGLSKAQRKALAERKAAAVARDAKMDEAGAAASRELSAAQVGVVRASLFDADDWRREHQARQQRMESTFSRLYKPQAGSYWTQKQKAPPRKPPPGQLPAYTQALPAALSLQHASSREQPSDDDDDDDDTGAGRQHPASEFDPMAEPRRFYSEFKGRLAALRVGVKDNPTESATTASLLPRAADAVVAAATAPSPPPPPPKPDAAVEAPSWAVGGGASLPTNPILDEDFDVEPGLVYTDSAHYLADHGVHIPMWDELDNELAALDSAHTDAMKALAIRSDAGGGLIPGGLAADGSLAPSGVPGSV